MADVWIVLVILAFFGLCVGLVWGCDKIIGPDEPESIDSSDVEPMVAPVTEGADR